MFYTVYCPIVCELKDKTETEVPKLFSLKGAKLKLNGGTQAKSNSYCIVVLRCKMVLSTKLSY